MKEIQEWNPSWHEGNEVSKEVTSDWMVIGCYSDITFAWESAWHQHIEHVPLDPADSVQVLTCSAKLLTVQFARGVGLRIGHSVSSKSSSRNMISLFGPWKKKKKHWNFHNFFIKYHQISSLGLHWGLCCWQSWVALGIQRSNWKGSYYLTS